MNNLTIEQAEKILSVSRNDSLENIKKKYYEISKAYHPDKVGNNNKIYEINNAYNTLKEYKDRVVVGKAGFRTVEDATVIKEKVNFDINSIKDLDPELAKIFQNVFSFFKDFLLNKSIIEGKTNEEIMKLINESLKLAFKAINKKLTQKIKYDLIKLILQSFKININIDDYLETLGIKENVKEKNTSNNNYQIIFATCDMQNYIKLMKEKKYNTKICLENNITKIINLKVVYVSAEGCNLFLICTDSKGKVYKINHT